MWTQALEAQQVAVTELLVVVLVEEALQVVATELLLDLQGAQLAVVTELPLVAADPQDMPEENLTVNRPAVAMDHPIMDHPAVELPDTPGAALVVNRPAVAMDLQAVVEDRGEPAEVDPVSPSASLLKVGMELCQRLEVTSAVVVRCLLKVVTVPPLVVEMGARLVIRGGEGGEAGMEGGGTEGREGMVEREREGGMEGVWLVIGRRSRKG